MASTELPSSYSNLKLPDILLSHVPSSSPGKFPVPISLTFSLLLYKFEMILFRDLRYSRSHLCTITTYHLPLQRNNLEPVPTPIILIILHRPTARNAFTDRMASSLVSAFDLLSLDPRVKCIVVTGHGKFFCAGADLDAGLSYETDTLRTHRDGGGLVYLPLYSLNLTLPFKQC